MNQKAKSDINRKLKVLRHAEATRNISKTCRYFGISRESFYQWKRAYTKYGDEGLINSRPCPENPKLRTTALIEEKILYLRKHYHFGPLKISWYLKRFHDIHISRSGCYYVLLRNGLNRLPENSRKRSIPSFKRYEKKTPGHHVQVDVKFLFFKDSEGRRVKRFQYTAIDDTTRIRALKVYEKHNQA